MVPAVGLQWYYGYSNTHPYDLHPSTSFPAPVFSSLLSGGLYVRSRGTLIFRAVGWLLYKSTQVPALGWLEWFWTSGHLVWGV